ncbi:MAG: aminotransferase class I/II-fold pyridoxal phosphate-dependent enzyme [Bacteroidota bacterium]
MQKKLNFGSLCVHDFTKNLKNKPHQLPIYATSSFSFTGLQQGIDVFSGKKEGHLYSRYGNPTIETVADKIANLETFGLELEAKCLLFSSGMAAISGLLMAMLKTGDQVLTQNNLYGGTTYFFNEILSPLGVQPIFADFSNLENVEVLLKKHPKVKMIYLESPANPTLACIDLEKIVTIAKKYKVKTAIDNTFLTPYLQQPFQFGIDFIVHSTTKYLNGHGNSVSGAVVGTDIDFMLQRVWKMMKLVGTNSNAFDAWLLNNGLKTLELRMKRHCENANAVAEYLSQHPQVKQVNHPSLQSHPDYELAKKQMRAAGGMLSFELMGGFEAGLQFMDHLKFCTIAPTLGDVDTLIVHPASMSHLNIPKAAREAVGITDGLIRISVGIENVEDIIDDLAQAIR